jgi:hypothetical protein
MMSLGDFQDLLNRWLELVVTPFQHFARVWLGIVPLYVSLLLGELYKSKVSFGHAVGNGFTMIWTGLNWAMHLSNLGPFSYMGDVRQQQMVTAWTVTACVIALGVFAVVLGLRKKDKTLCSVLGHTRFSLYFLILFYPLQIGLLRWNWPAVVAVLVFVLPCWFLLYVIGRILTRALQ